MSLFSPLGFQTISIGGLIYESAREHISGDPQYYGYLNTSGAWIIQQRTASTGIFLYAQGKNSFGTYWNNRNLLTYAEYNTINASLPSGL